MLDQYLKVALRQNQEKQASAELRSVLDKLPLNDLFKIATGQKLAHESTTPSDGPSWLEQFKGTAMLPAAVELERKAIEIEAAQAQAYASNEESFRGKDQINLQKRLLEVQLAEQGEAAAVPPQHAEQVSQEASAGAQPQEPPPGAGPPPADAVAAEEPPKMASIRRAFRKVAAGDLPSLPSSPQMAAETAGAGKTPSLAQPNAVAPPSMKMAEAVGRRMAQMDKVALSGAAIGAGLGGLAGLAGGLQKDEHGNRHILQGIAGGVGGAAVGAGLGHAAGRLSGNYQMARQLAPEAGRMKALQEAGGATAHGLKMDAKDIKNKLMPSKAVPAAAKPAAAPATTPVVPDLPTSATPPVAAASTPAVPDLPSPAVPQVAKAPYVSDTPNRRDYLNRGKDSLGTLLQQPETPQLVNPYAKPNGTQGALKDIEARLGDFEQKKAASARFKFRAALMGI